MSILRQTQGHLDAALSLAERALAIRIQFLGRSHPKTIATQTLIGHVQVELGCNEQHASGDERTLATRKHKQKLVTVGHSDFSPLVPDGSVLVEADPIEDFLAMCCELHPRAWCRSAELWHAYTKWAVDLQERYPLSRGAFIAQLREHGCRADRMPTARIWRGITLIHRPADGG